MKLSELKEASYGVRLYKMPSEKDIRKEARWSDGNFADLKKGYEALWQLRSSLCKIPGN
jgi:hypothetical protein